MGVRGVALGRSACFLIYPATETFILSFANATSTAWVGMENYTDLLTSRASRSRWATICLDRGRAAFTVALGLAVATWRTGSGPRAEKLTKSAIFLPLAISGVGAATIWRFSTRPVPRASRRSAVERVWTASGSTRWPGLTWTPSGSTLLLWSS